MNGYLLEWPNRPDTLEFLAQLSAEQTFSVEVKESEAWLQEAIRDSLCMNFIAPA